MAYKFPDKPSAKAYIEELADYWEIKVIQKPCLLYTSQNIQNRRCLGQRQWTYLCEG